MLVSLKICCCSIVAIDMFRWCLNVLAGVVGSRMRKRGRGKWRISTTIIGYDEPWERTLMATTPNHSNGAPRPFLSSFW